MKLTRHNGRSGKHGTYNPKHNDRSFDLENSEHINAELAKKNVYWDCYNGFRNLAKEELLADTFEEVEEMYYSSHYRSYVEAQNQRNEKNRHPERNRTTSDLLKNKKTAPEETIFQIGTIDNHAPPEVLLLVVTDFLAEMEKRFGKHVHILDWALHMDEGTPHIDYYRTRVQNADGKLVALYARTPEELYDKELGALEQIDNDTFCRKSPTVADYCEKWLLMQSVHVRATTLIDYTSKVRRHIIKELGQMRMADVTLDDIQLALVPVSEKSASVYKSVVILYKSIFRAAKESKIIDNNPTTYLTAKGGGVPQKDKAALTDEQAARLLDAIQGLPPYVFVMLGLYAGLRREEILALKWDSVYLDVDCPYLTVRRAWHTENNRPVILDELKTKAAHRNIPLPVCLADCLKETKANSQSEYVVPNRDGNPLSYTQFKRLWQYIVTRTVKERFYYRYEDGKRVKHTVTPVLGEKAAHNGKVIYSLDFEVTPHQLRHTYITNLIHSSVDPKTVQYLAGHESSKITMDIYAKVKYNRPDELVRTMGGAFAQWDAAQA